MRIDSDQLDELRSLLSSVLQVNERRVRMLQASVRQSSIIVQFQVHWPSGDNNVYWVKKLISGTDTPTIMQRALNDYEMTRHLYKNTVHWSGPFVPRPIHHSTHRALTITEHVDGQRLQDNLQGIARSIRPKGDIKNVMMQFRATGQWLREFQRASDDFVMREVVGAGPQKIKDPERVVSLTLDRLQRLLRRESSPLSQKQCDDIAQFLSEWVELSPRGDDVVFVHGDFFPGNLICHQSRATGVDFASLTRGSAHWDVGYFVWQMQTLAQSVRYRAKTVRMLIREFLIGYGELYDEPDFWHATRELESLFIAYSVSRLSFLVDLRRDRWHQRTIRSWAIRSTLQGIEQCMEASHRSHAR